MKFKFAVQTTSYERRLELRNITLKTPYTKFQCSADEDKKRDFFHNKRYEISKMVFFIKCYLIWGSVKRLIPQK